MSVWMIWPTLSSRLMRASSLSMRASVAGSTRPTLFACGHSSGCTLASAAMPAALAAERRIAARPRSSPVPAKAIMSPSMRDLVDANVVDFHPLGKDRVVDAFISAPCPADGDIEDQVLGRVEWPHVVTAARFTVELKIGPVIRADRDPLGCPGELIAVERRAGVRNRGLVSARRVDDVIVGFRVNRSVDYARVEADVLHDVDLADVRPVDHRRIGQHPDRGPGPATAGQLRANLEKAVSPAPLAVRHEPRRRVILAPAVLERTGGLVARLDDQRAVLDPRILAACGRIVLPLLVR